jgi:putative DNA primase/helicase
MAKTTPIDKASTISDALKFELGAFDGEYSDMRAMKKFAHFVKDSLLYLYEMGHFLVWDEKRFVVDGSQVVLYRIVNEFIRDLYHQVGDEGTTAKERKVLSDIARKLESDSRIKSMLNLTKKKLAASITEFDTDPFKLNVQNGIVNLKTGEILPHKQGDRLLKICPVEYNPEARSDLFDGFLERVLPDPEVRLYVQKALGYSITGETNMEKLFFAYGPTATGKTTLLNTVELCLGDYAATTDFETFLRRDKVTGAPRNDIARLAGRRLVTCAEVGPGRRLNAELINRFTGGDTMNARFLYQEDFEFKPISKLWWCANNRPLVDGPDNAIWRRLVQIPFTVSIPEDERDPTLKKRLRETALPSVLKWLIDGALLWQQDGLKEPEAIKEMTNEYKQESDPLKDFVDDCCKVDPMQVVGNSEIFKAYKDWSEENGDKYGLGRKRFSQALKAKGFEQFRDGNVRLWHGLCLID